MNAWDEFCSNLNRVRGQLGPEASDRALLAFSECLRWLLREGHGNMVFSALGGVIAKKIRTENVISIEQ